MSQLNIHLDDRLEKAILRLMKLRGLRTKSETVRVAIEEALERAENRSRRRENYKEWLGLGLGAPLNPTRGSVLTTISGADLHGGRLKYPLNLGVCFAYALAVADGSPILAADDDFRGVDRPVVLPQG